MESPAKRHLPFDAPKPAPVRTSDRALVRRAQAGDKGAFEQLATDAMPRLLGTASRLLGTGFVAEEAVADALFRAWRRLDRFQGVSTFHTWVHRILCRIVADRYRGAERERRQREALVRRATDLSRAVPDPSDRLAASELERALRRATDVLPPMQRLVLLLVAWEGLALREVADVLDVRYATVKSNLHHARRAVRAELEDGGAG